MPEIDETFIFLELRSELISTIVYESAFQKTKNNSSNFVVLLQSNDKLTLCHKLF